MNKHFLFDGSRRAFLAAGASVALGQLTGASRARAEERGVSAEQTPQNGTSKPRSKAQIAITLDLEMSREYPKREITEWDYQKGNLDDDTKRYSVDAARIARENGGLIHFFCVGRVLEHPSIEWLQTIAKGGHPIGNHTYDHVYVLAKTLDELQFRFRRAPWLIEGRTVPDVIRENIAWTTTGLRQRAGIATNGFRTPGGFADGLTGREDIQRLLLESGFRWVSAKYPAHMTGPKGQEPTEAVIADIVRAQQHAQPFTYPSGLLEIPMSPISDVNAFRSNYWKLSWFLRAIEAGVRWAIENRAVFDLLAHPSCMVVEDPNFETIKLVCKLVKESGDRAEIVGLDTIAAGYLNQKT